MIDREYILLEQFEKVIPGSANGRPKAYVNSHYSNEACERIKQILGQKTRITYGSRRLLQDNKYNYIFDFLEDKLETNQLILYRESLLAGGIITIGYYNQKLPCRYIPKGRKYFRPGRKADLTLQKSNLVPIFREPVGKSFQPADMSRLALRGTIVKLLSGRLPSSLLYSPYILIAYKFDADNHKREPYRPETSLSRRMLRVAGKISYINGHPGERQVKVLINQCSSLQDHKKGPKKVLIIALTYLSMGGVERVILNIIKNLDRDIFDVHIITTVAHANPWHKEFKKYADHIVHIPQVIESCASPSIYQHFFEKYAICHGVNVLFITNSTIAYRAITKIKKRLPKTRVYDLLHTHGTPQDNDAYLRISMPFDKLIDKRIVIDEYLKEYYIDKYDVDRSKVYVVYNGIDHYELTENDIAKGKDFFNNIPSGKKVFTYIGRLEADKSPQRLVGIAVAIKKMRLPASIAVIGDGSMRGELLNEAKARGVNDTFIHFYKAVNNPVPLLPILRKSYFTILVSDSEGIPMSILESMSVSTPAISSSVGGVPEIISHAKDGYLVAFNAKSTDQHIEHRFAEAIATACSLKDKDYALMQRSAKKKVDTKFSDMAQRYSHLFETGEL